MANHNFWQAQSDDHNLRNYIEQEVSALHRELAQFEQRHPDIAQKLQLLGGHPKDPDMTLMLEGIALLMARLQQRLDSNYDAIAEQLLNIMAQEVTSPLPAAAIIELLQLKNRTHINLDADSQFIVNSEHEGQQDFRTPFTVSIPPWQVESANLSRGPFPLPTTMTEGARVGLQIVCSTELAGLAIPPIEQQQLDFYINPQAPLSNLLFDLMAGPAAQILIGNGETYSVVDCKQLLLPAFADQCRLLNRDERLFPALQLLREFFAYPDFFRFLRLPLHSVSERLASSQLVIWLLFEDCPEPLLKHVTEDHIKLRCLPIVNLYEQLMEPINMNDEHVQYPLKNNPRYPNSRVYQVLSVKDVTDPSNIHALTPISDCARGDQCSELYWNFLRRSSEDSLIFMDTRPFRASQHGRIISSRCLCYDMSTHELPPYTPIKPLFDCLPGSTAQVLVRSWSVRGLEDHRPGWLLLSSLLLNPRNLFCGDNIEERLSNIMALFFRQDSGLESSIINAIKSIVCEQEVCPVSHNTHRHMVSLGCRFEIRLKTPTFNNLPSLLFLRFIEQLLAYWRPFGNHSHFIAGLHNERGWRWDFGRRVDA